NIAAFFVSLLALSAAFVQILIFVRYSHVSGSEQLNAAGGVYRISELLVLALLAVSILFILKYDKQKTLIVQFCILVSPLVLMVGGLFIYQMTLTSEINYYYYKLLSLLTLYIGAFFIAAVVTLS